LPSKSQNDDYDDTTLPSSAACKFIGTVYRFLADAEQLLNYGSSG